MNVSALVRLLTQLRVEPVSMLFSLVSYAGSLAMQQLVQDKLCVGKHSLSFDYCNNISSESSSSTRDSVMADVALYSPIKEYATSLPNLVVVLFVGSWCDRFPSGRKNVILLALTGCFLSSFLLLVNSVFTDLHYMFLAITVLPSLLGNSILMTAPSYIIATTDGDERSIRLLLLEIFCQVGKVIGFMTSGWLMSCKSFLFPSKWANNHADVFLVNSILMVLAIAWAYFRVERIAVVERDAIEHMRTPEDENSKTCMQHDLMHEEKTSLFTMRDLLETLQTATRRRKAHDRLILLLLVTVYAIVITTSLGAEFLYLPLSQLLYKWNIQKLGFMLALCNALKPIVVTLFTALIASRVNPTDLTLILIGLSSSALGNNCLATMTSEMGFYLYSIVSSLKPVCVSGIQSAVSRIVSAHEVSKILSLMALLDALMGLCAPAASSLFFGLSLSVYPTLVIHALVMITIVSMMIVVWIERIRREQKIVIVADAVTDQEPEAEIRTLLAQ